MYVVLSVIILFSLWMLQALGQKISGNVQNQKQPTASAQDEQIRRHLQMREEMHKRIRDKLINGFGSNDDLFEGMDQMMNEAFSDSFMTMDSLSGDGPAMKLDWQETKTGRTLLITPEDPAQKIDLDVKENSITIKGEVKNESPNGTSLSQFSNSFPVPNDCDGSKVKISNKAGKIVMDFPFKITSVPSKPKDHRAPIKPLGGEVSI